MSYRLIMIGSYYLSNCNSYRLSDHNCLVSLSHDCFVPGFSFYFSDFLEIFNLQFCNRSSNRGFEVSFENFY